MLFEPEEPEHGPVVRVKSRGSTDELELVRFPLEPGFTEREPHVLEQSDIPIGSDERLELLVGPREHVVAALHVVEQTHDLLDQKQLLRSPEVLDLLEVGPFLAKDLREKLVLHVMLT